MTDRSKNPHLRYWVWRAWPDLPHTHPMDYAGRRFDTWTQAQKWLREGVAQGYVMTIYTSDKPENTTRREEA